MPTDGWIGVDFDGTLSIYDPAHGITFGPPVVLMQGRVMRWLSEGKKVKILTARAGDPDEKKKVEAWLKKYGFPALEVTDKKDFQMIELWDDRAIQIIPNTGMRVDGSGG